MGSKPTQAGVTPALPATCFSGADGRGAWPELRTGRRPGGDTVEDRQERIDRALIELLNEIRVVLPGPQVLLASLHGGGEDPADGALRGGDPRWPCSS